MDVEEEIKRERLEMLREYVRLLEKVSSQAVTLRLNPREKTVLDALERRVSWVVQALAVAAGLGIFGLGLVLARYVARSPLLLGIVVITAGAVGLMVAVEIYRRARAQVAWREIRAAQLEIYKLEDELNK